MHKMCDTKCKREPSQHHMGKCSKETSATLRRVTIAVCDAVCEFNFEGLPRGWSFTNSPVFNWLGKCPALFHKDSISKSSDEEIACQGRFKLISGPGLGRSTGPLGTGGSKFITRKSNYVQLIRDLGRPMDKPALVVCPYLGPRIGSPSVNL
ncbi:hypothetical protein TNCV_4112591 [Trichonephila clavipes]|nr:hypothetical protein TNCV_4112591 [Trichonephila clavipes]